jgi:HD-GYP domain-containing protein (c-di-GMP phosphodiesterase class II)
VRVVVVSHDLEAAEWLGSVLRSAGLSVVILPTPDPRSPELEISELLVADRDAAAALGPAGPAKRILLVPRGQTVDLATAMGGGFGDLIVVPSPEDDVLAKVARVLDHFLKPAPASGPSESQIAELTDVVERVVEALRSAGDGQRSDALRLAEGMLSVFSLLIDSHETGARRTPGHSRRTGAIVREAAKKLSLPDVEVGWLELAGRLQDLGLVVLDLPLGTSAPLELEIRRAMMRHPRISSDILAPLGPWGLPVAAIAGHHERPDGSGYPAGLKGDEVSLETQILGASDVYEALVSDRPWRRAEEPSAAIEALGRMGFAPDVVDAVRASGNAIGPGGRLVLPPETA